MVLSKVKVWFRDRQLADPFDDFQWRSNGGRRGRGKVSAVDIGCRAQRGCFFRPGKPELQNL